MGYHILRVKKEVKHPGNWVMYDLNIKEEISQQRGSLSLLLTNCFMLIYRLEQSSSQNMESATQQPNQYSTLPVPEI